MSGGLLTVEPGAWLLFDENVGMVVNYAGSLSAVGTDEEPIVLTGGQRTPGFWQGLTLRSTTNPCELAHVTIEYGGGDQSDANVTLDAFGVGTLWLTATDCAFRHGAGCGVSYGSSTSLNDDFETANTFAENEDADMCPL